MRIYLPAKFAISSTLDIASTSTNDILGYDPGSQKKGLSTVLLSILVIACPPIFASSMGRDESIWVPVFHDWYGVWAIS
jgi:hypothetical protein